MTLKLCIPHILKHLHIKVLIELVVFDPYDILYIVIVIIVTVIFKNSQQNFKQSQIVGGFSFQC